MATRPEDHATRRVPWADARGYHARDGAPVWDRIADRVREAWQGDHGTPREVTGQHAGRGVR